MQPARQAKIAKRCHHLSPATSRAASSPDEATASSCHIKGWHAPKLAGHRGDVVVARSDASMVGQGDHLGTMLDSCHDRCFKFRLGRLVETIRPLRPAQERGMKLLATDRRRNEQQCSRTLRCKINSQGSPAIASRLSSARRDRQQGNQGKYQSSDGRSLFLNNIARDLWSMCHQAQILLVVVHRPGKVNVRADRLPC